ncbi:MAG: dTDP-4-dehydrorhamnose 3,5-epimerase [Emcibacter sp.]|nr:dTDP-4-dehydrorhamnose 3,5-epimerase [Emcibacter sp.]
MKFTKTAIPDLITIEPKVFGDDRGFFMETWRADDFSENGIDGNFVQDNHSKSKQGILRGLHYQIKQPQGKLVRVVSGEIYDVAVDMRKSSPTYGQWAAVILSANNNKMLWVPAGFAHGFYVMSDEAEFVYKCTDYYAPEYERSLLWNDPDLAIEWPLVDGKPPLLSEKDKAGVLFSAAEAFP